MNNILSFIIAHKWTVALVILAGAVLTLLLTVGFWKTVLIVALLGVGYFVGYIADHYGFSWFTEQISKIFKK